MGQIIPKLNLNKTPQQVDNNSMIFAKNVMLAKDNTIVRDTGIEKCITKELYEKLYNDVIKEFNDTTDDNIKRDYTIYKNIIQNLISNINDWNIVGVIPYNTCFYLFYNNNKTNKNIILNYDEKENKLILCNTNWNWSGGKLTGVVTINLRNDVIITIGEYTDNNTLLIPLKIINLTYSSISDNESIYTQAPNIPFCNLKFVEYTDYTIANGVYQFFIRYKIHDNYYTKWFSCSKPYFAGYKTTIRQTLNGSISYIDTNKNSNSFVFDVELLNNENIYDTFQLGFIHSQDNNNIARIWKEFDINTQKIYFTPNNEELEDIDITDILDNTFQLYNVKHITLYKTMLYLSDYTEFDNNPNLQSYADKIKIDINYDKSYDMFTDENTNENDYQCYFTSVQDYVDFYDTIVKPGDIWFSDSIKNITYEHIGCGFVNYGFDLLNNSTFINNFSSFTNNTIPDEYKFKGKPVVMNTGLRFTYTLSFNSYNGTYTSGTSVVFKETMKQYKKAFGCDTDNENDILSFIANDTTVVYAVSNYIWNGRVYKIRNEKESNEFKKELQIFAYLNKNDKQLYKEPIDSSFNRATLSLRFIRQISTDNTGALDYAHENNKVTYYVMDLYTYGYNARIDNNISIIYDYKQKSTLLPLQSYLFYVHFVKRTGEYTNGYLVDKITVNGGDDKYIKQHSIIYPSFTNIEYPTDYVGCFFSICNYENKILELIPKNEKDNWIKNKYFDCLEIDSLLEPIVQGTVGYDDKANNNANYFSGDDIFNFNTYGNTGTVVLDDVTSYANTDYLNFIYIKTPKNNYKSYIPDNLCKCTPIITSDKFADFNQMNLLGYLCYITKIRIKPNTLVSSGKIYKLSLTSANSIVCEETDDNNITSTNHTIYSNYNLNYLSKADDAIINNMLVATKINNIDTTTLNTYIESTLATKFYELPKMYYEFTKKIYSKISEKYSVDFKNTIRRSRLVGDEAIVYGYKFYSEDYYNVPSNKGIITNLVAVGSGILVHTEDSMFRFSGYNSLNANDGDVQTKESDVFDTGIVEILGSERGYGGLQDKRNSILTHNVYMFYDNDSNIIYSYDGNNQNLKVISDDIYKYLYKKIIKNIDFAEDYYNDRIFINIAFIDKSFLTLSYNTVTNSFISLHDFDYDKSFNTKTNCYFVKGSDIYKINKNKTDYSDLQSYDGNTLSIYNNDIEGNYMSIIDIMFNSDYNKIKNLNSINWICSKIKQYVNNNLDLVLTDFNVTINNDILEFNDNRNAYNLAEEELDRNYSGDSLIIYTDSANTGVIDISSKSNNSSIRDNNFYKRPRYNLGTWSLNYFRNILDQTNNENKWNTSDNRSLIYGKYIVARFIFDRKNNFKLENVTFNIEQK